MTDYETLRVERPDDGIVRVVLDRPERRNAQDVRMTYELNDAFDAAMADDGVKVVLLVADGPHFCSGHDTRLDVSMQDFDPVGTWREFRLPGAEGFMAREQELYLQMCWRWRNLPKPLVAAAQGKTIAGGLPLLWVCDVIVAGETAQFADPTVAMGVNGVEFFAHPWELGARKAKELLFTGDWVSARDACALGMVNHVVADDSLQDFTLDLCRRIAAKPAFALKLAKLSVNQALDAQGQWTALQAAMSIQQLAHSHNRELHGMPVDLSALSRKAAG